MLKPFHFTYFIKEFSAKSAFHRRVLSMFLSAPRMSDRWLFKEAVRPLSPYKLPHQPNRQNPPQFPYPSRQIDYPKIVDRAAVEETSLPNSPFFSIKLTYYLYPSHSQSTAAFLTLYTRYLFKVI